MRSENNSDLTVRWNDADTEQFKVTKRELEIICQLALRQTIPHVKKVEVRQEPGAMTWELYNIRPMPKARDLEIAMEDIAELQKVFQIATAH